MQTQFAVLEIQVNNNDYKRVVRYADSIQTAADGTILLDACPSGTMNVWNNLTAVAAAKRAGISESTVRRQAQRQEYSHY